MKSLTLLLVEDNQLSRKMLLMQFEGLFERVLTAVDGTEGLQLFCEFRPDIVLTDQVMPNVCGLDMVRNIRAIGAKTPVVLMTSSIDNQTLLDAINIGIERFVPKPFDFDLIIRILDGIAREIVNARRLEQHQRQEVELLRYRDSYNSLQQESSRRKERHVIRHDRCNQALEGCNGARWGISVAYAPRDIMCGDGYSVRNLFDGRQLIFVVDAMGSGMSASLTAMLSTSFLNYQVENLHHWENFTLRIFIKRFQEYLSGMLLEEEVLSCGLFLVDLVKEEIETAIFALPPLLLRNMDGSVRQIRGNNPPIGIYPCDISINTLSLTGVADLLIMTDGVTEAPISCGGSYSEELQADFCAVLTLAALQNRFKEKTDKQELDDFTLLHLHRLDFDSDWSWQGEPDLTLEGLGRSINEFLDLLTIETRLDVAARDELEISLTETLTNAFEHGCLGIAHDEKSRLILEGSYDDLLGRISPAPDAKIVLYAALCRGAEHPLLRLEVIDSGPGLPDDVMKCYADETSVNGRGLQMLRYLNDAVFVVGGNGGHIIVLKTLKGRDTYAN